MFFVSFIVINEKDCISKLQTILLHVCKPFQVLWMKHNINFLNVLVFGQGESCSSFADICVHVCTYISKVCVLHKSEG